MQFSVSFVHYFRLLVSYLIFFKIHYNFFIEKRGKLRGKSNNFDGKIKNFLEIFRFLNSTGKICLEWDFFNLLKRILMTFIVWKDDQSKEIIKEFDFPTTSSILSFFCHFLRSTFLYKYFFKEYNNSVII